MRLIWERFLCWMFGHAYPPGPIALWAKPAEEMPIADAMLWLKQPDTAIEFWCRRCERWMTL